MSRSWTNPNRNWGNAYMMAVFDEYAKENDEYKCLDDLLLGEMKCSIRYLDFEDDYYYMDSIIDKYHLDRDKINERIQKLLDDKSIWHETRVLEWEKQAFAKVKYEIPAVKNNNFVKEI